MRITLTRQNIRTAILGLAVGFSKYAEVQKHLKEATDLSVDYLFQRRFNGFYRVRRNEKWRISFFKIFEAERRKGSCQIRFCKILQLLKQETGRVEASFASKLVASIDTSKPIIDSVVLKNVSASLPYFGATDRISRIVALHDRLSTCFDSYLKTDDGQFLVDQFEKRFGIAPVHQIKMIDFVLWNTRLNK